mgnify:CR=1 FL=1
MKLLAQLPHDLAPDEGLHGPGPIGTPPTDVPGLGEKLALVVSVSVGLLSIGAGLWFLWQTILSGYAYMTAGSDKEKVRQASQKLTQSIMGLVIVILATFLINFLGYILRIDFLDIAGALQKLTF